MGSKVLVTGHAGYIGSIVTPALMQAGYEVIGVDTFLFASEQVGQGALPLRSIAKDIRDISGSDLEGVDAIVHLGGIVNDARGELDPALTYDVNLDASVRLAELAKHAGVERFLFASSCSVYGASQHSDDRLDEESRLLPVSAYAVVKAETEARLSSLASRSFCPVYLRNATAYGASPNLRVDLLLNEMAVEGFVLGRVSLHDDADIWRPLVHVEDIAKAFVAMMSAPVETVNNQAFNVGSESETYQMSRLAELVQARTSSALVHLPGTSGDRRSYRPDFSKFARTFPNVQLSWDAARGVDQLVASFRASGVSEADLNGCRYVRLKQIRRLLDSHAVHADLRPREKQ